MAPSCLARWHCCSSMPPTHSVNPLDVTNWLLGLRHQDFRPQPRVLGVLKRSQSSHLPLPSCPAAGASLVNNKPGGKPAPATRNPPQNLQKHPETSQKLLAYCGTPSCEEVTTVLSPFRSLLVHRMGHGSCFVSLRKCCMRNSSVSRVDSPGVGALRTFQCRTSTVSCQDRHESSNCMLVYGTSTRAPKADKPLKTKLQHVN